MIDMGNKLMERFLTELENNTEKAQAYFKDAFDVLLSSLDYGIAATPYEVLWQQDRVKLKYYKSTATDKPVRKTPIFIVYALVNRETMLDLQPGRSVVEKFLAEGMDIYMLDWGYPTQKDKFLSIDDHVNGYMNKAVNFILEREKVSSLNLMGICMGGTFCTIYASLHPENVKNLILTVTPTSFNHQGGILHIWAHHLDTDAVLKHFGNMPGDLLNMGFLLLNPARLIVDKYHSFLEKLDDKDFVENFVRMERWIYDSPDVPGETFREFIEDFYKKDLLIQNKLVIGGKKIDLKKITMPVLNIYARQDHLVPPEACEQITSKIASTDKRDFCLDTGHIGIYVSSKSQRAFAPTIMEWLLERDGAAPTTAAPKPAASGSKKSVPASKSSASTAKPATSAPKKEISLTEALKQSNEAAELTAPPAGETAKAKSKKVSAKKKSGETAASVQSSEKKEAPAQQTTPVFSSDTAELFDKKTEN